MSLEVFVKLLERIAVVSGDLSRLAISVTLLLICLKFYLN